MTCKTFKHFLGVGCAAIAAAMATPAFGQGCGGTITPDPVPGFTTYAVGQDLEINVLFGPTGNSATINTMVVVLECFNAGGCALPCTQGGALSYRGDATIAGNTCGVGIASDNPGGGTTGTVTFTFNPPLVLNAGTTCQFRFGVTIESLSADNSTKQITGTAQFNGQCANGLPLSQCGSYLIPVADPQINIIKDVSDDNVCQGEPVSYTYQVTNTGNAPLSNVVVVDDNGTPGNLGDDFSPTFVGPDVGNDGILSPGETWQYTSGPVVLPVGTTTNIAVVEGDFVNTVGTVTVTDQDDATVVVNPPPTCAIEDTPGTCEVTLCVVTNACGPVTYAWTGPGGFSSNQQCITLDATSAPGDYCVTVTDCNGCVSGGPGSSCCYTFVPPFVSVECSGAAACEGGSGNLCATVTGNNGPFTVQWFNAGNQLIETCSNLNSGDVCCVTVNVEGNYRAVVTDAAGCTDDCIATFDQFSNRLVQINDQSICQGSPTPEMCATITGGVAPYTVTWRDAGNNVVQVCNNVAEGGQCCFTPGVSAPGVYTFTITAVDSSPGTGGCVGQKTVSLTINERPTCNASSPDCLCPGETTTLSACPSGGTAPYTVIWRNPSQQVITTCNNVQAGQCCESDPVSAPGTYTATVIDANGCENTCTATVTACPVPSCSISVGDCPFPRTLTAVPSNCSGCTFQWGTADAGHTTCTPLAGENGNTLIVDAPGDYCLTVTSADGCTSTCYVNVPDDCETGQFGCTPGYWKQCQHFSDWICSTVPVLDLCPVGPSNSCTDPLGCPSCTAATKWSDVFEDAFPKTCGGPSKTLLQVLKQAASDFPSGCGSNQLNNLGRHTVAALLNAAQFGAQYSSTYSTPQAVIDAFNAVYPGTNAQYNALKNTFVALNEQGCPLNGHSDLNKDGIVSQDDLDILLSNWKGRGVGDLNADGIVDAADVVQLMSWWGQ